MTKMIVKLVLIFALLGFSVELEKGDIVRYPGHCSVYNHYAVYVGKGLNDALPAKTAEQDTFEMTRENSCVFGNLREKYEVFNYMEDGRHGPVVHPRSWDEMASNITDIYNKGCGTWTLENTCEHMATRIRYGDNHSKCMQYKTLVHLSCLITETIKEKSKPVQSQQHRRRRRSQKHPAAVYPAV